MSAIVNSRQDPALVLHRLIEPEYATAFLDRHLSGANRVLRATPYTVRPKSQQGGLVGYEVTLSDDSLTHVVARIATPERARAGWGRFASECARWTGKLAPGALVEDAGVVLTTAPLDRRLRMMRPLMEAGKAKRLFQGCGAVSSEIRVSKRLSRVRLRSYRPERRAVLEWTLATPDNEDGLGVERRLFLRLHASGKPPVRARAALLELEHDTSLAVPRALAAPGIPGVGLEEAVGGASGRPGDASTADAATLGRLTARLHRHAGPASLPCPGWLGRLEQAERAVGGLRRLDPGLGQGAGRVLEGLRELTRASSLASPVTLLHGDLHDGQLLCGQDRDFLVDFDRARRGSPAEDIASYLAHLILSAAPHPAARFAAFRNAYVRERGWPKPATLRLHSAAALLCLADAPFRRALTPWRALAGNLIRHAEAQLDGGVLNSSSLRERS